MSRIENTDQLRAEIARLRGQSKQQEELLRSKFREVREDLKPKNILWNAISSITGMHLNKNQVFKEGIAFTLSFLIQRFILKTEKKVEGQVYSWVDQLFDGIKEYLHKHTGPDAKRATRDENPSD